MARSCTLASATAALVIATTSSAGADPPRRTAALLERAKQSYAINCQPCHGATGEGNGPVAFALRPRPRNFVADSFKAGDSPAALFGTITGGLPGTLMVGYPALADQLRWGLAYYVLELRQRGARR